MKRKVLGILLCVALAASLVTGCSSSTSDSSSASSSSSEESTSEESSAADSTETSADSSEDDESGAVSLTDEQVAEAVAMYAEYEPAKDTYNFTFIPKLVHTWYEDVRTGIETAVAELAERGITVNYTWDAPSEAVVTDQIEIMESAASNSPDGISVAIIDPSSETSIVDELISAGINVSTFDVDAPDSDRLFYCGHSTNYEDAYEMTNMVCEAIGGEGQIAILAGSLSASNHQDRVNGIQDCIADNWPNVEIVDVQADEDTIETALSVTEGYLSAYSDLKAIIGVNAAVTGACRAVADAGLSGEVLVAGFAEDQEAMEYVEDGTLYVTLKQNVEGYGYHSVYNMILIADGEDPYVQNFELAATFVTSENVADYLQ